MNKTEQAHAALQAVYNFHDSGEAARIDKIRIASAPQRPANMDPEDFADMLADRDPNEVTEYGIEKMSAHESLIAASGLERDDFYRSLVWLAERSLLWDDHHVLRYGGQLPTLSHEGEDIIDLGMTVTDWYHGPYKRRHYEKNTSCCGVYMGEGFGLEDDS